MIEAKWLFENHLNHLAMVQFLTAHIATQNKQIARERAETIEALSLGRPVLDGMPRGGSCSSSTERIALLYENLISPTLETNAARLAENQHYLALFDSVMTCLTDNEKWIIEKHYIQKASLAEMQEMPDSPIGSRTRTTLWRYKERAVLKADAFLSVCQKKGDEDTCPPKRSTIGYRKSQGTSITNLSTTSEPAKRRNVCSTRISKHCYTLNPLNDRRS